MEYTIIESAILVRNPIVKTMLINLYSLIKAISEGPCILLGRLATSKNTLTNI